MKERGNTTFRDTVNDNISGLRRRTRFSCSFRASMLLICMLLPTPAAWANIAVIGDLTRDYQLRPGQTHEAMIELENRDSVAKQVIIYQTDYRYTPSGESIFPAPKTLPRSNAGWITFSPKSMTIAPMQRAQVRYLIRAPRTLNMIGTYWSMLMVQETQDRIPGNRSGVQILTQLMNTGRIGIEFTSATVDSKAGKRILSVDIENRGSRIANPEMWLEVYNGSGQKVGRFITDQGTIHPGCGIRREIDISSLPKGSYNSLFIADSGGKDVYGLEIKLILEGEPEPKPAPAVKN